MRKILLTILIISGLCLAVSAFAQITLEQTYPSITDQEDTGVIVQQTLTGKTRLPGLIKYFVNWSIIIASLIVVISLVIGGVQYLTSSGRPQAMTDARSRITNSFLGLAILAGSYLILVTINPQLTVLSLIVKPVDSGVVMFTKAGYDSFTVKDESLTEVMRDGGARIFNNDIEDLTELFGPLIVVKDDIGNDVSIDTDKTKTNFADFPLYAIAFWGDDGSFAHNIKIKMYNGKDFKNTALDATIIDPKIYGKGSGEKFGRHQDDGNSTLIRDAIPKGVEPQVKMIWIEQNFADADLKSANTDFFLSTAEYITIGLDQYRDKINNNKADEINPEINVEIYHPPLSIAIQGTGPGMYLYSEKQGHRYLVDSHTDLSFSDLKFDNLANMIEINNYERGDDLTDPETRPSHNYMVVLHDYYNFSGNLKMFFERDNYVRSTGVGDTDPKTWIPIIYFRPEFKSENVDDLITLCNGATDNQCTSDNLMKQKATVDGVPLPIFAYAEDAGDVDKYRYKGVVSHTGNVQKGKKLKTAGSDQYGGLGSQKTSSVQIFEIVDPISLTEEFSWKDFARDAGRAKECREVRLCTEKGTGGYCISYTPSGRVFSGAFDSITLPMPYFTPTNIPHEIEGMIKSSETNDWEIKKIKMYKNIKSIYIRGDCLVALYENPIIDLDKCIKCNPYEAIAIPATPTTPAVPADPNCQACFEGGASGSHSEIFLDTDYNLTDNEIGMCGGRRRLGMGSFRGCASAIAVFPLKVGE